MIASRTAFKCRAVAKSAKLQASSIRLFGVKADVQVEHGRGSWQMYGDLENYKEGKYQIKTFNKISPVGLAKFPENEYDVRTGDIEAKNAHAILLRSHKLQEEDVPKTVRAIARCVALSCL
jgi:D-3-phosphoglycerate dehydrogenase